MVDIREAVDATVQRLVEAINDMEDAEDQWTVEYGILGGGSSIWVMSPDGLPYYVGHYEDDSDVTLNFRVPHYLEYTHDLTPYSARVSREHRSSGFSVPLGQEDMGMVARYLVQVIHPMNQRMVAQEQTQWENEQALRKQSERLKRDAVNNLANKIGRGRHVKVDESLGRVTCGYAEINYVPRDDEWRFVMRSEIPTAAAVLVGQAGIIMAEGESRGYTTTMPGGTDDTPTV